MYTLNNIEKIGRLLCKSYYNGEIQPSQGIEAKAVEDVIKNCNWMLELMSGLLSRANVAQRTNRLGAGYISGVYYSIDGREEMLRVNEVAMYAAVGNKYRELLKKSLT